MRHERLVVLGAKHIERTADHCTKFKEDSLNHLLPIRQVGHRLAYTHVTEDGMGVIPANVAIAWGEELMFGELLVKACPTRLLQMLDRHQRHSVEFLCFERHERRVCIVKDAQGAL